MSRRLVLIAVSIFALVVLAAGSAVAAPRARLGKEFTLKPGQVTTIAGEGLTVGFLEVQNDSRCPKDVVCIWAGNAEVAVFLSKGTLPAGKAILNTNLSPQNTIYFNYDLRLVKLEPYPVSTRPIPQTRYRATFVVTKPIIET